MKPVYPKTYNRGTRDEITVRRWLLNGKYCYTAHGFYADGSGAVETRQFYARPGRAAAALQNLRYTRRQPTTKSRKEQANAL